MQDLKMTNKIYSPALSIAGFDGSGGAGMQADIKTFSALGCYGTSVLTSLPIQNTQGVRNIYDISIICITEQLAAIFDDIEIAAIKIGMLHKTNTIQAIADYLVKNARQCPIILDPVMVAKSGHLLLKNDAISSLKKFIFPITTLITPNILEAEVLINEKINSFTDMEIAAKKLLQLGTKFVLLKGGHFAGEFSNDILVWQNGQQWFEAKRHQTKNTHGTGCTLSAAITACIAQGYPMRDAVAKAKIYLTQALQAAAQNSVGKGHGPVHHFYHLWPSLDLIRD